MRRSRGCRPSTVSVRAPSSEATNVVEPPPLKPLFRGAARPRLTPPANFPPFDADTDLLPLFIYGALRLPLLRPSLAPTFAVVPPPSVATDRGPLMHLPPPRIAALYGSAMYLQVGAVAVISLLTNTTVSCVTPLPVACSTVPAASQQPAAPPTDSPPHPRPLRRSPPGTSSPATSPPTPPWTRSSRARSARSTTPPTTTA